VVQETLPYDSLWGQRVDQDFPAVYSGTEGPAGFVKLVNQITAATRTLRMTIHPAIEPR
jgi:hypothetical protein